MESKNRPTTLELVERLRSASKYWREIGESFAKSTGGRYGLFDDAADRLMEQESLLNKHLYYSELDPCPFCGHDPIASNFFDGFFWYWRIRCEDCAVMMESVSVEKEDISKISAKWNNRYAIEIDEDREPTGLKDAHGDMIHVGDRLYNPFVQDKWDVVKTDNGYEAWLIPNSGFIHHQNGLYPQHRTPLDDVIDSFEICDRG